MVNVQKKRLYIKNRVVYPQDDFPNSLQNQETKNISKMKISHAFVWKQSKIITKL
jgi:hypothetical protein